MESTDEIRRDRFEIACADGWRLRGEIVGATDPPAVVVAGHAMMVDRRTLDRPPGGGMVSHLARRGLAVVVADLRGHGQSGPLAEEGGQWSYDDLVQYDAPALLELARARFPRARLTALGHSLFGHVLLAYLCRSPEVTLDGLVLLACNVTQSSWRRRPLGFLAKTMLIETLGLLARNRPLPVRRLRAGTCDESSEFVADFVRWGRVSDWRARDGFSYLEHLERVRTPILAVVGAGDRLYAPPADVRDLMARVPSAQVEVVGRLSGLPFDPGHMAMVLDGRLAPVWDRLADFFMSV